MELIQYSFSLLFFKKRYKVLKKKLFISSRDLFSLTQRMNTKVKQNTLQLILSILKERLFKAIIYYNRFKAIFSRRLFRKDCFKATVLKRLIFKQKNNGIFIYQEIHSICVTINIFVVTINFFVI